MKGVFIYMSNNAELVEIGNCPPGARSSLTADAIQWMKDNGRWPKDPSDPDDGGGSGGGSSSGDGKHVCEPDYELKHPKKNFPFWI